MTNQTIETVAAFVSQEVESTFASAVAKACKGHAKADANLVGTLLASARDIGRPVTEDDWNAHLVAPVRKAMKAKVAEISVRVYVGHAKATAIAATGRPPISEALPLGKHWTDQLTVKRRPEGIHAWLKRVKPLLELATRNEDGHLILPEGYSLLGETTASPEAETTTETTTETTSAGAVADQEGGLNVDPGKASEDARMVAATALLGAKAATAFLALISDKEGKASLAKLMSEHAKAKAEADAKAKADAKAGQELQNLAA
jgi:hypothetical protein